MGIKFRISKDRNGIEADSTCNFGIRGYFIPTKELPNPTDPEFTKIITPYLFSMIGGVGNVARKQNISGTIVIPTRILIYYDAQDGFFSIAMGFAFDKVELGFKMKISELRYEIPKLASLYGCFFIHVSNYEITKPVGDWDEAHCSEAPIFDVRQPKQIRDLISQSDELMNKGYTNYDTWEFKDGFTAIRTERLTELCEIETKFKNTILINGNNPSQEGTSAVNAGETLTITLPPGRGLNAKKIGKAKENEAVDKGNDTVDKDTQPSQKSDPGQEGGK